MNGSNNQDFRNIPALWPATSGLRVLDLGCGQGLYAGELARRNAFVVAVDQDRISLSSTRYNDGKVAWVCADADHLPFREDIFDMIVSVEVLSHIHPQVRTRVFYEMERVMAAGGIAYFTLHNRLRLSLSCWLRLKSSREVYHTNKLNVWPTLPSQTRAMLAGLGLELEPRVMYLNYHSRFTYRFHQKHPQLSKCIVIVEELLRRLPLARKLAITFLHVAIKRGYTGKCASIK
jgi:SAM-dependent methyltransferase